MENRQSLCAADFMATERGTGGKAGRKKAKVKSKKAKVLRRRLARSGEQVRVIIAAAVVAALLSNAGIVPAWCRC